MANTIEFSKFSSLDFNSKWKHHFEADEIYCQKFTQDDIIRIQYTVDGEPTHTIALKGESNEDITPVEVGVTADGKTIYNIELTGLDLGCYSLQFINEYDEVFMSTYFKIKGALDLIDTTKLRYTHRINDYDVIFQGEKEYFFDFRFEGGILFSESKFNVTSNSFRDQRESARTLSAYPYKTETLTIGDSKGVPSWVAEKVNLIFCLSDVELDGKSYVRNEGSTPEINEIIDKFPLYIYKMEIEPQVSYVNSAKVYPFVRAVLATEDYKMIITEDGKGIII